MIRDRGSPTEDRRARSRATNAPHPRGHEAGSAPRHHGPARTPTGTAPPPSRARGDIILAAVAFASWRTVRIWWPVFRLLEKGRVHRLTQSFWLLMLPFVAYAYMVSGAWGLLHGETGAVLNVGGAVLALFAISL